MISPARHERLRFPTVSIFLLGGLLGTGLNAAILALAHTQAGWHAAAAFFAGTMANLLFHHVYYHLIFVNREIQLRTPFWRQSILYVLISAGAAVAGFLLHDVAHFSLGLAATLLLSPMAATNAVVNRIATFSSAQPARVAASDPGSGDWPMWGGTPDRNMVSSMKGAPDSWDVAPVAPPRRRMK